MTYFMVKRRAGKVNERGYWKPESPLNGTRFRGYRTGCRIIGGMTSTWVRRILCSFAGLAGVTMIPPTGAQQIGPELFGDLHWRSIGPFRGGRTRAAAGVPGQPNLFYMGQVNGGVWKSDDYGRTWIPIFDSQPTGSIGAIAVAPSDPNIIYVASGEGLQRPDLSVATASTNPPTLAKPGHTWASATASRFLRSP